ARGVSLRKLLHVAREPWVPLLFEQRRGGFDAIDVSGSERFRVRSAVPVLATLPRKVQPFLQAVQLRIKLVPRASSTQSHISASLSAPAVVEVHPHDRGRLWIHEITEHNPNRRLADTTARQKCHESVSRHESDQPSLSDLAKKR